MSKLDWHNSIHKQTKSENILVIFDLWTSDFRLLTKETIDWRKSSNFKREEHCPRWWLSSPNKRLTYKKCFVRPVVDSKVNLRAEQSNDPRWSHRFQKCFHVSKMANHPSEISSLMYTTVESRKHLDLYYTSNLNITRGKLQKTYYAI